MEKIFSSIWDFFTSVKLALFNLFALAFTSIIGTVLPQKEAPGFYAPWIAEKLPSLANASNMLADFFLLLDFNDMYHSWWFVALLALFTMNLVICSLNRIPGAWRLVVMDNLATDPERLRKMGSSRLLSSKGPTAEVAAQVEREMKAAGWRPKKAALGEDILLFAQKGAWTRLGVYIVHSSILVIFIGAIIGLFFGQKGGVNIPEMGAIDMIYEFGTNKPIPLGFSVRCDRFELSYYDNGSPKEYRSDLVVVDKGREVLKKSIVVNDPLDYKGFTFYQSSYNAYDEFLITLNRQNSGANRTILARYGKEYVWPQEGVKLGILNVEGPNSWGDYRLKIWFSDGRGPSSVFWLDGRTRVTVERPEASYQVSSKQFYTTGLQVAKDPGVWYVYIGCSLMLFGLLVAFFMSHRRIWFYVAAKEGRTSVLAAGLSNKNKLGFERDFETLIERLQKIESMQTARE